MLWLTNFAAKPCPIPSTWGQSAFPGGRPPSRNLLPTLRASGLVWFKKVGGQECALVSNRSISNWAGVLWLRKQRWDFSESKSVGSTLFFFPFWPTPNKLHLDTCSLAEPNHTWGGNAHYNSWYQHTAAHLLYWGVLWCLLNVKDTPMHCLVMPNEH